MADLPPGFVLDSAPSNGPVYGPPPKAPAPPTPFQIEDQQIQRNAEARAVEDQQFQREKFAFDRDQALKKQASGGEATEAERKAAAFLIRALGSNDSYEAIDIDKRAKGVQGIGPRSAVGQYLSDNFPNALNSLPGSVGNSPDRQVADTNQDEFIAASLRQDSGAAIPPDEMERQRRIYFPMPGDGPDVIAAKRQARLRAIEGLKQSSGRLGDNAMQRYQGMGNAEGVVHDDTGLPAVSTGGATPPNGGGPGAPTDGGTDNSLSGLVRRLGMGVGDIVEAVGDVRGLGMGVGDIVEAVGDVPGLVTNPISTSIGRAMGYDNYTADLGSSLRDLIGLPDNPHSGVSAVTKAGVGALTGSLAGRGLASLVSPGATRAALSQFGATPGRDMLAGAGAGAGGELGREVGGIPGQVIGTIAGGVGGYKAGNAMMPRQPNALMQAADSLDVTMLPADVGGVGTRMASGATQMTLGGIPMAEGAEKAIGSAAAARSKIAKNIGDGSDNVGAGQAAKRGFASFDKASGDRATQLYERVSVPAKADVQLGNTRQALAEVTKGMESNPELSRLWANHPRLRATLEALTPKDTREAGGVRYTAAEDKLKGAESAFSRARSEAEGNLAFEQSQARDALDAAHSGYDDLVASARKAMEDAQDQADMLRNQVVSPAAQAEARQAANAATERFNALRNRDASVREVADALKPIKDAEAAYTAARFREPQSEAMSSAQEAISGAKSERDAAFVESRQAPQGGQLSWEDMKRFRSIIGEVVGQPGIQRDGSDIAALRKLYGALTTDMEVTAAQTSPRALQEFRRATQYWRGREGRIDDVFATLLGKDGARSDEAVFKQINSWAQGDGGDFGRLARTIRSLPADEANTIRSTLIQRMGMAKPANQDATGEVFSPSIFSTQWRSLSDRAKNVLFPSQQHRQDLEKLADITDHMKRANDYRNYSKTSLGVNATAQGSLALANLPIAAALAGMQFGAGKLLASPAVARLMASSAKLPPEQAGRRMSEQLKLIAVREPQIANEVHALQDYLAQQFVKSPGRAAAEDTSDSRRKPPEQR